jgi:flagellar M-ring protein FliF
MGPGRIVMLLGVTAALIGFFYFFSARLTAPNMALLYSDVSPQDGGQIIARLEQQAVPYELRAGGSQIWVPEDRALRMRMTLAEAGLPRGGTVGYELFDRSEALGSTTFLQNVNQLRALEGELSRTITSLGPVAAARVHLVVPRRELFQRERQDPTASVVLRLRDAGRMPRQQVSAIQHLIASAVPGLRPQRVSVVDDRGVLLARGQADGDDAAAAASTSDEMRRSYEQRVSRAIEELLERTLGPGKVRAEVNAEMDFDRITTNTETFDPDGQVVRSSQTVNETQEGSEAASASAPVSVAGNLPDGDQSAAPRNQNRTQRTEETTNFEISRTTRNHVRESGQVKRLSVAVLVDGNSTTDANGQTTYQPRSAEELQRLTALVRSAVGFNQQRGDTVEVANLQFAVPPPVADAPPQGWFSFATSDMIRLAEILALALVGALVTLLVARPLVANLFTAMPMAAVAGGGQAALPGRQANPALPAPSGAVVPADGEGPSDPEQMIDISQVDGRVKASSIRKIGEIVEKHPEEAVSIVRNWMYQDT